MESPLLDTVKLNRELVLCGMVVVGVIACGLLIQENKQLRKILANEAIAIVEKKPCGCVEKEVTGRFEYGEGDINGGVYTGQSDSESVSE